MFNLLFDLFQHPRLSRPWSDDLRAYAFAAFNYPNQQCKSVGPSRRLASR